MERDIPPVVSEDGEKPYNHQIVVDEIWRACQVADRKIPRSLADNLAESVAIVVESKYRGRCSITEEELYQTINNTLEEVGQRKVAEAYRFNRLV